MTYIELINDFWREFERNDDTRPIDDLLYLYLLKVCNSTRWKNPFGLSNKQIRLAFGITDKAISESRRRLVERGLIEVTSGKRNVATPIYRLLRVDLSNESNAESRTDSRSPKNSSKNSRTDSRKESLYIDNKDYCVVDDMGHEEFLEYFFSEERQATIATLCKNNSTDEATLRRLAAEVLTEWQATELPQHNDLSEAQRHLFNQIRIKLNIERQQHDRKNKLPAAALSRPVSGSLEARLGYSEGCGVKRRPGT